LKSIVKAIQSLQLLPEAELLVLDSLVKPRKLAKNEFFISEGNVCREMVFIDSGILRSFYHTAEGTEVTSCIRFEQELMSAFSSFITQAPSEENIQALVETQLWVLTYDELQTLYARSAEWQQVGRILTEMQYVDSEKRIASFLKQSAQERYESLIREHALYMKYIPQHYLASYLGITPRHLSRLRKAVI